MQRHFLLAPALLSLVAGAALASPAEDMKAVAALDTEYQLAVKNNDAATMDKILHDEFILVVGSGNAFNKEQILETARNKDYVYEHQDEEPGTQTVRVWGDTAVVTAKLWLKGSGSAGTVDKKLWFSDTYVRTPEGWRYAFGQASLALPAE